jgi:putative aldouronate transport system substrate-binding protein
VGATAAQKANLLTQYANPLYYGVVDVDQQLSKLKSAAEKAGLAKLQTEIAKQANQYLKEQKKA